MSDIDDRLTWDEGDFEITKEGPTLTEGDLYVPAFAEQEVEPFKP
jgi:hypothetical protein